MRTVFAWMLGLMVLIGIGVGIEAAVGVGGICAVAYQPRSAYHSRSALAAALDRIAINVAGQSGDPNVSSVTWAMSTRTTGASLVGVPSPDDVGNEAVYVPGDGRGVHLQETGGYRAWLTVVVDAAGLYETDIGLAPGWISLRSLGHTETDSLVGLKPS